MSTLRETVFLGATLGPLQVVRPGRVVHVPKNMQKSKPLPKGSQTKNSKSRRVVASEHNR